MQAQVGHHYVVKVDVTVHKWYPAQHGYPGQQGHSSREQAFVHRDTQSYHVICLVSNLLRVNAKIEELLEQDYGKLGEHNGFGMDWPYCVKSVEYKGEVRL